MGEFHHLSVLLEECMQALNIRDGHVYIDGTSGGAGHTRAIAERLQSGTLIALDQDPDAIKVIKERLASFDTVTVVQENFSNIPAVLDDLGISGFDGLLLDIGVSSHQLDTAERGFSYHTDAPLDMRMSQEGISAKEIVGTYDQAALTQILRRYGEEKYAASIARNIVKFRTEDSIETTLQLVEIIKRSMPAAAMRDGHPARRTFQALRIEVNRELERLEEALYSAFERANPGARIAVITFHSLEDRIVKQVFRKLCEGCTCPKEFPVCVCGKTPRARLPMKAVKPSQEELAANSRSRSAKLRVLEKLKD